MSNTQKDTVLRQRHLQQQVQQRQILAMMGIGQWIQPSAATLSIDDIVNSTAITEVANSAQPVQPSVENPVFNSDNSQAPSDSVTTQPSALADNENNDTVNPLGNVSINNIATASAPQEALVVAPPIVADSIQPLVEQVTAPVELKNTGISNDRSILDKVVPFDLQGGRYGNWVLIVDIQALDNDSEKLWQNMIQALSIDCETASFPICAGMDTAELANASLAGYIFKIGRSEDVSVAALTALPDGLTHPNFVEVLTLEAMLADGDVKRQFWEQISNQN